MCLKPYKQGVQEFGCGQCLSCRVNRRRLWTARIMLEATQHDRASFVTLTYNEEFYPKSGSVSRREMQLWLKRLRKMVEPLKLRYYVVGEYGTRSGRAHYHAVLFGVDCLDTIQRSWPFGFVYVGDLTHESAGYVVSYVTKGMTKSDDERLKGRLPEFALMSRKPGLGAGAVESILNQMTTEHGAEFIKENGDIPGNIRWNQSFWPLGRYLRRLLRKEYGFDKSKGFTPTDPYGMPDKANEMIARELLADLSELGGRERRELKRRATAARVKSWTSLRDSKKLL